MALKWGIVGASKISHDFCTALRSQHTAKPHEIHAIASRSKANADEFAQRHDILHAYGSYEELAQNVNIEVVYVAVLNHMHFEVVKMMLEAGKPVVCEKPFAMNHNQAKELISLAKKENLFLMEGLWTRFFPVYRHFSAALTRNAFGDIREVYVKHGFCGSDSARIVRKDMGGGIVLDIGCYAIQLVVLVFQEAPKSIKAEGKINSNGIDLFFQADLEFSKGRRAYITCSGLEALENQSTIISTKGPICMPTYWCPSHYIANGQLHEWRLPITADNWNYTNSIGLIYEADHVFECIRAGQTISEIVPPTDTLLIAQIQDEIRKQIGVQYDCDESL
ncbi:trans-1,2-dihydrobenzene-1,2-diol dehydrogenase-like [Scaptodrosophila lebanonensis]|uniref:Trans-1,2-dihydrobenzene-1,2-diol dehydrogenase n=1 Tax=Drosophila lebanonensis TaxID=7225 RepID=A0A6J2UH09_DROLE|nr:trans-1,2-dihydrobenzene-1,2-diol dehydrogenase-like [Scaptodrosophila lebanonensis]